MQIKETSDDARLAALNRRTDPTVETRQAEEPDAITPPRPVDERPQQPYQARKKEDRRKGDRRKQDRKVLLDTRSKRERRKGPRRAEEREIRQQDEAETPAPGLDVKC